MLLVQMTGLSGSGKSTLAIRAAAELARRGHRVEIIDGDEYRANLCRDLGFSREDRIENIRRLGFVGNTLARHGVIVLLAAISPYEVARLELRDRCDARTVWVKCDIERLRERDTKGLYERAFLPDGDPRKITNLTGVNDPYEEPGDADLVVDTGSETVDDSVDALVGFLLREIGESPSAAAPPAALFVGRWQPFHKGHQWLVDQKLALGIPVVIAVRDLKPDRDNPLTTRQTVEILEKLYAEDNVRVIVIPDIESINYGRRVGYEVNEFDPPVEIGAISATDIRNSIRSGSETWKEKMDSRIHEIVELFLG